MSDSLVDATAVIQCYYPEREKNLGPILDSIEAAGITRTIVWVNGTKYRMRWARPGVEVIQSSFDTLIGQYAAAFLATTELIYCQNDDLIVEPETIRRMVDEAAEGCLPTMVGIVGRMLDPKAAMPYAAGQHIAKGACSVLIGRAWAARKAFLALGVSKSMEENINPGRGEDMFFSFQDYSTVLDSPRWTDIPENGVGLCHEPGHAEEREKWARYLLGRD